MTRKQAIKTYLNHFIHSDTQIRRLMQWDPKLSIRDNADKMKVRYDVLRLFAKYYKLDYKKVGRGRNFRGRVKSHFTEISHLGFK